MNLRDALTEAPIVAILRGITPEEVRAVAEALWTAGIRIVEVPLNSPQPLRSIELLANTFAERLVIAAGTVLRPEAVDDVRVAGGSIIVAPNTDVWVIGRALDLGLEPVPGFATPTEAFLAYHAGARYLKLFPAATMGTSYLKALQVVLPLDAVTLAVGGVTASEMHEWWAAGARGFGIGSEIYRPGQSAAEVARAARRLVSIIKPSV